jgi:hypothetical protein
MAAGFEKRGDGKILKKRPGKGFLKRKLPGFLNYLSFDERPLPLKLI